MPNNSFKPKLLRSGNGVAKKACHAAACATQFGLTQVLAIMDRPMRSSSEIELYRYLIALGHSPAAVVYEPAFKAAMEPRAFRPDFAILNPKSGSPIAAVELKNSDGPAFETALRKIAEYAKRLGIPAARGFVATPVVDGFAFFHLDEDGATKQVDPSFLSYTALVSADSAEKKTELVTEKKETVDRFLVICVCLAALAAAVAVVDFIGERHGIKVLSPERLTVLAVAVSLVVLPYFHKFKALGVEIERIDRRADG